MDKFYAFYRWCKKNMALIYLSIAISMIALILILSKSSAKVWLIIFVPIIMATIMGVIVFFISPSNSNNNNNNDQTVTGNYNDDFEYNNTNSRIDIEGIPLMRMN